MYFIYNSPLKHTHTRGRS